MPKNDKTIDPLNASLEGVVDAIFLPATLKANKLKGLKEETAMEPATTQYVLDLGIEIQRDVNGIEMGVLENGIPFLTQRGLAKITGVSRKEIFDITQQWEEHYEDEVLTKDRLSFIKEYLFRNGYTERQLYIETIKDGSPHYAYPDIVCMAFLEYYAFESRSGNNQTALENFRKLATFGLQKFIYEALGYAPLDKWKYHNDRVTLLSDSAPDGYFIIFRETAGMVVDLIKADVTVNDKTIPDISVGQCWAAHWKANGLAEKYGERIEYAHNYPNYYPQAMSNPQPAKAYPDAAIPEFKKWFKHEYLTTKFPKYILTKANLLGGQQKAIEIGNIFQPKQIEKK